jgi:hypothetical protein
MIMRVNTIVTHFRPEDAYNVIELLDQLRTMLMDTYGDEIKTMLQEASQRVPGDSNSFDDDDIF